MVAIFHKPHCFFMFAISSLLTIKKMGFSIPHEAVHSSLQVEPL